ncbi:MAG TPA: DUF559 domain-containing protein [Rhodanobacteraceae bacterium]|nr:DUF559 domain-containing protein [Rhodanobacteraceae bacterium]
MRGQTNQSILKPKLQHRLRNAVTDAERLLWRHLRLRQLDGCKLRRQHPFGDYIVDFACLEKALIVELDGSPHAERTDGDRLRSAYLEQAGFHVLRFWNNEVFADVDGVPDAMWQALRGRGEPHPHPRPPLEGQGEKQEGS